MDNILKELFGSDDEPVAPAGASTAAAPAEPIDREPEREAQRAARREARQARKADPERKRNRDEFVDRYTTGSPSEGFTSEEAIAHIAEIRDELSPADFRKAMEQTLANLPPNQRADFLALMQQHKSAAAAAPAAAAPAGAAPAADPFGGLLTGLMGSGSASTDRGMDVGAILTDLQKGGLRAPSVSGSGQPTEADFQALINSPLGKAVLGGLAAYGMQTVQEKDDDTPGGTPRG